MLRIKCFYIKENGDVDYHSERHVFYTDNKTKNVNKLQLGSVIKVKTQKFNTYGIVSYIKSVKSPKRNDMFNKKNVNYHYAIPEVTEYVNYELFKHFTIKNHLYIKVNGFHYNDDESINFNAGDKWTFKTYSQTRGAKKLRLFSKVIVDTAKGKKELCVTKISLPVNDIMFNKTKKKRNVLKVTSEINWNMGERK